MQMDHIRAEVGKRLDAESITPERIKIALASIAFPENNDIADVEPYLEGVQSLQELRESGVDTSLVKSASSVPGKYGESRTVTMYDRLAALEKLARIRKLVDGDAPVRPPITVKGDVVVMLRAMVESVGADIPAGSQCLSAPIGGRLPALPRGEVLDVEAVQVEGEPEP